MSKHRRLPTGSHRAAPVPGGVLRALVGGIRPPLVVAGVAVLVTLIVLGGIALAYWRAGGTGTGSITTGSAAAVILSPATPTGAVYPGGRTDIALTVTNPNDGIVTIGSLALDTTRGNQGFAVDSAHAGCSVAALTVTLQTDAGAGWSIPAKTGLADGSLAISLPHALAMDVGAVNACQGALFTVYLRAGS
jgi:hypothetical protein